MNSTVGNTRTGGNDYDARITPEPPADAWKSAYGALVATAITIPLGVGFFLYEGIFALLSDAGAFTVGLFLAPLVWSLYRLTQGIPLDTGVFGIGVVSVAGICLGSLGLVVMNGSSLIPADYGAGVLGIQFLGWILLGSWLLGVGLLGRRTAWISARTSVTGIVSGVGIVGVMVALIYSYAVGSFTVLFPVFAIVFGVGFLLFLLLVGGELRSRAHSD